MLRASFGPIATAAFALAQALACGCGGTLAGGGSDGGSDAGPGFDPGAPVEAGATTTTNPEGGGGAACASCDNLPVPLDPSHTSTCAACMSSRCIEAVGGCKSACCPAVDDTCQNAGYVGVTQCAARQCAAECGLCVDDAAVACTGGATGHACATGATPGELDNTLACSAPVSNGGEDDICCFPWTFGPSQCIPQNAFGGGSGACPPQSYGFLCSSNSPPSLLDPALSCGAPTTSENAGYSFCCTRN